MFLCLAIFNRATEGSIVVYFRHKQSFSMNLKFALSEKWSDEKYSLGNPLYAAMADSGKVSNTAVTFKFSESNQM